ncbi:MAG: molybdate ABC transporter substrate-binding protein [Alphaproteobacteria bacterium]|nr:molybdate ABC transporter substrate-binding protein [Alphaproteobacteria bacterium]
MRAAFAAGLALVLAAAQPAAQGAAAEPVRLYAAGSLKAALGEVAASFAAKAGTPVAETYGASGLLRERIEKGEPAEIFASANMEHPAAVARARGRTVAPFATNVLCALARPEVAATPQTLLDRMLDPMVKLGISTPKADPSGDYAWEAFARAEALRPGARAALERKALQLTGGPTSPQPPKDRSVYGLVFEQRQADLFLTYRTNAVVAAREVPGLSVVDLPPALAVGATYGLTVLSDRPQAQALAAFIRSGDGQAILARHGFGPPPQQ